jgi:alkylhydroperoxidase family enzyme
MSKLIKRVHNQRRIAPVPADVLLSKYAALFNQLPGDALKGKNTPVEVFGVLLKSPKIAALFFPYWANSKTTLNLTIREQELIILRTGCYFGCDYVWGHHVPVALEVGVTPEELKQIPYPAATGNWSEKEKILLIVVDEILKSANVNNEHWQRLSKHWAVDQILDIITVISQYLLFNTVNNVFGTQLENKSMPNLPDV